MRKIIVSIAVISMILMLVLFHAEATGIAVSPSKIEISEALRGAELERVITIFNTDTQEDTFSLKAMGDINDWISFFHIDDRTTPISTITISAKDEAKVLVTFAIPGDTATGEYTSTIYVQSIPPEVEGGQAAVMIRMPIDITIEVTGTQVLTGTVLSLTTMDTEINYPLRLKIEFQNTGNVVAKPEIIVKITKNGGEIDEVTHRETIVKVDSKEIITVEWDTAGRESGDYGANVMVSLGDEVLTTQELSFKLFPIGTLSRQGDLTELSYENRPLVGRAVKILAPFVNTGEIESKAKFIGEVYVDGDLVDAISSEELLVPVGDKVTLIAFLKLEKPGSYTIKGHAVYEGKTTSTKELSFVAVSELGNEPQTTPNSKPLLEIPDCGALGAVLAIAFVSEYLRHRRRSV